MGTIAPMQPLTQIDREAWRFINSVSIITVAVDGVVTRLFTRANTTKGGSISQCCPPRFLSATTHRLRRSGILRRRAIIPANPVVSATTVLGSGTSTKLSTCAHVSVLPTLTVM